MKVLNLGSLNIDHVYRVPTIAQPGATVASSDYRRFPGGKGANQSVALARAGATVIHAGAIGPEGLWLKKTLAAEGIDVSQIRVLDEPGGHAIVQVEESGQNSIVIYGGANLKIGGDHWQTALALADPGDMLLLQNEINATPDLLAAAERAALTVVFNPAPMTENVLEFPLRNVSMLILNRPEAESLGGQRGSAGEDLVQDLVKRFPNTDVCLTLGDQGAILKRQGAEPTSAPAPHVRAVDTTGAGDTFIGFFLAGLIQKNDDGWALNRACKAAALGVTRPGAMSSIPTAEDVDAWDL